MTYKSKRQRRNNSETVREIRAVSGFGFFFYFDKISFSSNSIPSNSSILPLPTACMALLHRAVLPSPRGEKLPAPLPARAARPGGNERVIEVILPRDSHFPLLNQSCFPAEGWGRCCAMLGVGGVGGHFAAFGSGMVFRK